MSLPARPYGAHVRIIWVTGLGFHMGASLGYMWVPYGPNFDNKEKDMFAESVLRFN